MEFFYPMSFGFQFNLAYYITRGNNYVITKYQVPLGMNELKKKLDLHKMAKPKNKIELF